MATKPKQPLPGEPEIIYPVEVSTDEGIVIQYLNEGATSVVFEVNPKATRYEVRGDGQIVEFML